MHDGNGHDHGFIIALIIALALALAACGDADKLYSLDPKPEVRTDEPTPAPKCADGSDAFVFDEEVAPGLEPTLILNIDLEQRATFDVNMRSDNPIRASSFTTWSVAFELINWVNPEPNHGAGSQSIGSVPREGIHFRVSATDLAIQGWSFEMADLEPDAPPPPSVRFHIEVCVIKGSTS